MKNKTHIKYIQWLDTSGLHEDVVIAIAELLFLKDELRFLSEIVANRTLELIYGKPYEQVSTIGATLHTYNNRVVLLLKRLKNHANNLQFLMDEVAIPNELRDYKDTHYKLMMDMMDFHADVKKSKRIIFKMLADLLKHSKQKKLS